MNDVFTNLGAALASAVVFCVMTIKMQGALQQSGYKTGAFMRWLNRKDNLLYNRLFVLAVSLFVFCMTTSLAFSFLGQTYALLVSALPFFGFLFIYLFVDKKYALKVPYTRTKRFVRLFIVYVVLTVGINFGIITLLGYLMERNGSTLYALIAFTPFTMMPLLLPYVLCLATWVCAPFEGWNNRRYVRKAKGTLAESNVIKIGVVGSYGKTSVKGILKTILSERYTVLETPQSYNTPMGIARTLSERGLEGVEVFIAEMGARKKGDIAELCEMVRPDYALFTGVSEQHISTFESLENVFAEKSEILKSGAYTVCGEGLQERVETAFGKKENIAFAENAFVSETCFYPTHTQFTLTLDGARITVNTHLLGNAAVENILLAATLAKKMGLTAEEIAAGIAKIEPIPHRLQLIENNGVYVLDDGYNCNPKSAEESLAALNRFTGRKCVVTPGIVECGVLEETINGALGKRIAEYAFDCTILVGETLVNVVKTGYLEGGGNAETLVVKKTLSEAQAYLSEWIGTGDAVLFLNDLPDVY